MSLVFSLFPQQAFLIWPTNWLGILAFVVGLGGIFWAAWYWRGYQRKLNGSWEWIFGGLAILTPFTALVVGIRLPLWGGLPLPGVTVQATGKALMIFAALPVLFGGWLLGPHSGAILGALAGFSLAYFDTHSPFTLLEVSFLALLFSVATRQDYRTWLFRALSRPLIASLVVSFFYPLLHVLGGVYWVSGSMAKSLDFAISNSRSSIVAIGGSFIIAGFLIEFIAISIPKLKKRPTILRPSPAETSLEARFLSYGAWWVISVIFLLIVVNWFVAGELAIEILHNQMSKLAETTITQVPNFIITGQNLIIQIGNNLPDDLENIENIEARLENSFYSVPFFSKIYVLDRDKEQIFAYPQADYSHEISSQSEQDGLDYALDGIPVQVYAIPSLDRGTPAEISFLGTIYNEEEMPQGILVGRVELTVNPLTRVITETLEQMNDLQGKGYILNEQGQILYSSGHGNTQLSFQDYEGKAQKNFYKTAMIDGSRHLVYTKTSIDSPWQVLLTVPAGQAQELALELATPISGVIIILGVFAIGSLYISLNSVVGALHSLMYETKRIAKGNLDHSLKVGKQVDELGQLRHSFEKMRQALRARMQELSHLLRISQAVASSLEIEEAVQPILESALDSGGSSARIVLTPEVMPGELHGISKITSFGVGDSSKKYAALDPQILEFVKEYPHVRLQSPSRVAQLYLGQYTSSLPGAVLAVALRDEKQYYGALWLAYDNAHPITNEEMRFIVTLAGQAVLATTNAQLFKKAEVGRQRLAAILASTPDPVLVIDHLNRLLLANPAAWEVLDVKDGTSGIGQSLETLTIPSVLIDLLSHKEEDQNSVEVPMKDGRVFLAIASPVVGEGKQLGQVCVLRDITHLKEMDELKSNFVSTVSHDLRSPLTLMRGYATMLEMVGDLNKKQLEYVGKIVSSVESMSRLVKNLLDLGRIEAEVGLKLEMLSVHDIVSQTVEALKLHAQQKSIDLKVSAASQTSPLIKADQALVQQALHNLVENAIKYTPEGGRIWVRYRVEDAQMIFEVQDTGVGISPIDQERLYEKFYRVERRDVNVQSGTGLGLAIVKSIAEQHGGKTWLESELGNGSTFYLSIPVRQSK
ncbi:MAG: Sensor histidine kinase ResE [Chloroflexi bacterium]|nr:Sensor histidine kinase ResE [Chloroflexota bacterium]